MPVTAPKETDNPWLAGQWNITGQGLYVRLYGMEAAQAKAKAAGTMVGGPRPGQAPPAKLFVGPRGRPGRDATPADSVNPFLFLVL